MLRYKFIAISLAILAFLFAAGTTLSFAQDAVIAIVNNDIITQKDLNDFVNFMRMQLSAEYKGIELENKVQSMKLNLLQRLIEDRLILQQAKVIKMDIPRERIKDRIDTIRKRTGGEVEFQRSLKQQGLTQIDLETKIKEQLLMYNVIDYKIKSNIMVTPSEVTDFYEKNKKDFNTPEQRDFASISITDEKEANQVYYQLNGGATFEQIAQKHGLEISKFTVTKDEGLKRDIADIVFKLSAGETSKPAKIGNIYYIFKGYNIIPPRQLALSEAQETIHNVLAEKQRQDKLPKCLDELKKSSYIKIM